MVTPPAYKEPLEKPWTWHNNSSRGDNRFSIFASEFQKQKGAAIYYYGHLKEVGSFGGYIERMDIDGSEVTMLNKLSSGGL